MHYKPVVAGNKSNGNAGTKACNDTGKARTETVPGKDYILLPLWTADPPFSQSSKSSQDDGSKPSSDDEKKVDEDPRKDSESIDQEKDGNVNSTNNVNASSTNEVNVVDGKTSIELPDDQNMPALEDIVYSDDDEDVGAYADMNNLDAFMPISPIPTTRVHKDHPVEQIIRNLNLAPQTRRMTKNLEEHGLFSSVQQRTNHKDFQNCLFTCFLSQEEPKKVIHASKDPSWIEAMQEELLQFTLQEVWTLVELPNEKLAIGTKWAFRNKKDERRIVIKNKARLVAQGYTREEVIDYDEVFAPIARIEAIRLFLPYALFKDFVVYQMDVNSAFIYGKIEEEVYVCQPPRFEDPDFPDRVYKVEKALYGLHQALKAWYETLKDKGDILLVQVYVNDIIFGSTKKSLCTEFEKMMHKKFHMSFMGELIFFLGLQVNQKEDGIFISQDKYVTEILKKFSFTDVKTASTPMKTQKVLFKDKDGEEVDVNLYRSMIGSLMYLTSSRPDIMFAVCACARYQVNPKVSHLHAVKRIFRHLKGQPKFGLWYPKDSPFDLVAYTDSDYAGASLDRKSTIGGCQFLGSRLILWQCKKQTVVANSTTEAEYMAASSCCGQVFWIQNQLVDYGDCNEKKLIHMVKIHTDKNVADLLIKAFDVINAARHNLLLLLKVNAARHTLLLLLKVNAARYNLLLLLKVNAVRHKLTTAVENEAVYKEMDDSLERAATTATSLDAEQDRGGGPKRQETIGDTISQTGFKNVSKTSNDSMLAGVNTPRSDEDSLKLKKLMELCTNLQNRVIDLEKTISDYDRIVHSFYLENTHQKPKRKDTQVPQLSGPTTHVADEAVHKELGDNLVRAATTASSLEREHGSGGGPRGNTLRSDGDILKLNELMELCTNLQNRVLDLEKTKTTQANEVASLKRRVKKLEHKKRSRTHGLKRLRKVGATTRVESSRNEESLDEEMFDVDALNGKEVFVAGQNENIVEEVVDAPQFSTAATTVTITTEEITLAQALKALKTSKPKVKWIVFQDPSTTTTITTISSQQS
ncbi:putative ribonuclease H-like domain-containing protein [Tanacetum coccineum]